MRRLSSSLFVALLLTAGKAHAQAVRVPTIRTFKPDVSVGSMTLSATPSTVNFTLVPGGAANGSSAVTITTNVSGLTLLSTFSIYGYFATTSALTTTAGDIIPSSAVFGRCPTGSPTSFTAFTQSSPFAAGSSLTIFQASSLLGLIIGGNLTEVLSLKIDLTSLPQQPAGNYTGTLVLQAQAL